MGEVHVKVRLSNAVDREMAAQGLLESDKVRSCEVNAIVDTGATRSVIPPQLVRSIRQRDRDHR